MIKIKKIKPMFTSLITTMNTYEEDETVNGLLVDMNKRQGGLKEYQTVIAVGDSVRGIVEGDLVCVNPTRFGVKKHREGSMKDGIISDNPIVTYNFDIVMIDDKKCLLLQDRDIDFIIEDYEETPDNISSTIIKPEDKKIII